MSANDELQAHTCEKMLEEYERFARAEGESDEEYRDRLTPSLREKSYEYTSLVVCIDATSFDGKKEVSCENKLYKDGWCPYKITPLVREDRNCVHLHIILKREKQDD